ncbi:MAG: hypothetical protein JWM10_282, partial [Myxococcaceae bacterium]|nr:hypothetical protein [Myxococcaceae bacterium]
PPRTQGTRHRLLVLNLSAGTLRTVDNARGRVGFTPDGSTIVSYCTAYERSGAEALDGGLPPAPASLLLVDAVSLRAEEVTLPLDKEHATTRRVRQPARATVRHVGPRGPHAGAAEVRGERGGFAVGRLLPS